MLEAERSLRITDLPPAVVERPKLEAARVVTELGDWNGRLTGRRGEQQGGQERGLRE
jgi:hypothetical protein